MAVKLNWHGDEFARLTEAQVERVLDKLAGEMVDYAKAEMMKPKSGKDYRKAYRKAGKRKPKGAQKGYFIRQSSAPGEFPAVQQGWLLRSVQWVNAGRLRRHFGTNRKQGRWMELGTKRIRPRPWLRPTYRHFIGTKTEALFTEKGT